MLGTRTWWCRGLLLLRARPCLASSRRYRRASGSLLRALCLLGPSPRHPGRAGAGTQCMLGQPLTPDPYPLCTPQLAPWPWPWQ